MATKKPPAKKGSRKKASATVVGAPAGRRVTLQFYADEKNHITASVELDCDFLPPAGTELTVPRAVLDEADEDPALAELEWGVMKVSWTIFPNGSLSPVLLLKPTVNN